MNNLVYTDMLYKSLTTNANRPALHIKREGRYQSWTYSDFHRDLNRLCYLLKKQGVKKGVNALVIGENSPEWIIAYHGIILSGGCTVPVDPNIPPSEIESILSITEAKVVFCSPVYLSLFRMLKEKYHHLEKIILLDSKSDGKEPAFDQYIKSGNEEKEAFSHSFQPDDPMVIIFTSGTTGKAKGVVLTQKNFTAIGRYGIPRMKANAEDTMCAVLPLHHVFGSAACIAAALTSGMDVVLVPFVKGPLILEALRDKQVTILPAVPKMITLFYESIMHNVKKKGPFVKSVFTGMKTLSATAGDTLGDSFRRSLFSSVHKGFGGKLRLIISGGAALNKKYWTGFRLMGFNILEGYGLTETYGPITVCPADNPKLGFVGPALPENEIKIDNPDESGVGEVLLRGSCVFKGYYKNDELTSEVIDTEGWFHTGDLGKLDKDGFLQINGRKKDMIVLDSGKNVYPDELEDFYSTSPLIEEIGVFGVNQSDGEIVAATIVPCKEIRKNNSVQQSTDLIYNELIRLGKTLPVYRRITDFVTVYTPLPRTTTRKLKKNELRKIYNSIKRKSGNRLIGEDQLSVIEMALMDTEEYRGILHGVTTVSPRIDPQIINPRSHLEIDLGLDSLKRIELLSHIEQHFSLTVPEDTFDKMETVGDLVTLLRERKSNTSVENVLGLKERILADSLHIIDFTDRKVSLLNKAAPILNKVATSMYSAKSSGLKSLNQPDRPFIFASNHNHSLDAFWILNSLPNTVRENTFFIEDKETRNYPQFPYMFHKSNMIKVEKCGDPIEMLKAYLAVIRNNKHLIVFPEGPVGSGSNIRQFKSGIGLLARETGASIIPVKISPAGKSGSGTRTVTFGAPVRYYDLIKNGTLHENCSVDDISDHIRTIITTM
ncbi:MAG: AMP-binding protein [Fibrobacter sp.]|nr:AMP-binding protein [Fibrobacter sp.]